MFLKNYQMSFLFFLVSGTFMATSSSSWVTSWLGLEINLMSLIPLILSETNFKSTESAIKYFLAQALASVFMISAASISALQSGLFFFSNSMLLLF